MRIAHIAVAAYADRYARGDYHMVISPWLYSEPKYVAFYENALRPEGTIVIMDNGAFEGHMMAYEPWIRVVKRIKPNIVVLPDVILDPKQTLIRSRKAILQIAEEGIGIPTVAFVTHGSCPATVLRATEAWLNWWTTDGPFNLYDLMLAVPCPRIEFVSPADWDTVHKRSEILDEMLSFDYPIHLLGVPDVQDFLCNELPREDIEFADTSLAFALGADGKNITPNSVKLPLKHKRSFGDALLILCNMNRRILANWGTTRLVTEYNPMSILKLDTIPKNLDEIHPALSPLGWYDFVDDTFKYSLTKPDQAQGVLIKYGYKT